MWFGMETEDGVYAGKVVGVAVKVCRTTVFLVIAYVSIFSFVQPWLSISSENEACHYAR